MDKPRKPLPPGRYPAVFLSRFQSGQVLKANKSGPGTPGSIMPSATAILFSRSRLMSLAGSGDIDAGAVGRPCWRRDCRTPQAWGEVREPPVG